MEKVPPLPLNDILYLHFPGFISIRDKNHKIIHANHNFTEWIKHYSDIDIIGLTNEQIATFVKRDISDLLMSCHNLTLDYIHNNINSRVIKFKNNNTYSYLDVVKFKYTHDNDDFIVTLSKLIEGSYHNIININNEIYIDELTKVNNRKILNEITFNSNHLFVYLDLDNFKKINDQHGHLAGDDVLIRFVLFLRQSFRGDDYIIRTGGDEFLIIIEDRFNNIEINDKMEILKNKMLDIFPEYPDLLFAYGQSRFIENISTTLETIDKLMYNDKAKNKEKPIFSPWYFTASSKLGSNI